MILLAMHPSALGLYLPFLLLTMQDSTLGLTLSLDVVGDNILSINVLVVCLWVNFLIDERLLCWLSMRYPPRAAASSLLETQNVKLPIETILPCPCISSLSDEKLFKNLCRFENLPYICNPVRWEHFGRLAQLVQSVCLTSRGSGVRIPHLPQL